MEVLLELWEKFESNLLVCQGIEKSKEKVNLKVKIEIAKSRLWTARSQNHQVCHNPDPLLELQADLEIFYNGILI